MKIILLVGFLLVGLVYSTQVETSESSEIPREELRMKAILDYLSKKCPNENDSRKTATEIFIEISDCMRSNAPKLDFASLSNPGFTYENVCPSPEQIEKIPECFQPVIDKVKTCGNAEEEFLPDFILDAVRNLFLYICGNDGKNIEKIFQESATECLATIVEAQKGEGADTCKDELEGFIAMLDDGVMTKTELCDAIEAEKVCNSNLMEKMCPNDSNLKECFVNSMDAISSSCSK